MIGLKVFEKQQMKNSKLNVYRYRDLDQLFTLTFDFVKKYLWQYIKLILICMLPFIAWACIVRLDSFVSDGLNIFKIFNATLSNPIQINSIVNPINLLSIVFFLLTVSILGALVYASLKLYKDGADIKKLKLRLVWNKGQQILGWILFFNVVAYFLFTIYLSIFTLLSTFIYIGYALFIWSYTLAMVNFAILASAKISSLNTVSIVLLVFVLLPLLIFTFRVLLRLVLLILYSVPLKLEKPNLSFTERLSVCNLMVEKAVYRSWLYIHVIGIVVFFVSFVCSIPIYGLLLRIGLFEQPIIVLLLNTFFTSYSYGLAIFLTGFSHIAISLSFYNLYAKMKEEDSINQQKVIIEPISYQLNDN